MGVIYERLTELAKRCGDLSPIQEPVRQVLWEGNKERALAGTDAQGVKFAPLAPQGAASRIVTGYVVQVTAGPGELRFVASWPDVPWVEYHVTGGPHLPIRDPMGYRQQDLEKVRGMMREYVTGWGGAASRFASRVVSRAAALF